MNDIFKSQPNNLNTYPKNIYTYFLKPLFDRLLSLIALVLLLPFFIIIAIAIIIDSKGPVFFIQNRLGQHGKVFRIFKFRTMVVNGKSTTGYVLYEDDPRITRVGRLLRKTSIDELPQLFNVLRGNMSFIGPRPPVTYFPKAISEYNEIEFQRFMVKPGISGLAQIRSRDTHDWDKKIPIDIEYVHNYGFLYDLKLFFTSLTFFFRSDNIYSKK